MFNLQLRNKLYKEISYRHESLKLGEKKQSAEQKV